MAQLRDEARASIERRLNDCWLGGQCQWDRFYRPRQEKLNFATRYHLVYPALAYFIEIKRHPETAAASRPTLDAMYRGLIDARCWSYWYEELGETTWPLQERNLTYAGRLATFIGLYIDAFGKPPAERIWIDNRSISYSELSASLAEQMETSPNCGVSCYEHQSMVMCNAHMLINNLLHDRLFGTEFKKLNGTWMETVLKKLMRNTATGPLFYFGTEANSAEPIKQKRAIGADIWSLFLMSAAEPDQVSHWFEKWQANIRHEGDVAFVEVASWEREIEFSSDEISTAWAYCLAREMGNDGLSARLRAYLTPLAMSGVDVDPYFSGLVLLGDRLAPGDFRRLICGTDA